MIPHVLIRQWKEKKAPWQELLMVEQDLIISRALIELYNRPLIKETFAFRGGTALNKLYLSPPARYSEDIDLVQINAAPIGQAINEIRLALDHWLGEPKRKFTTRSAKLIYKYPNIEDVTSKLKIEINTTEHFHVEPLQFVEHEVNSDWFSGKTNILTFSLDELMGTKLRALYQRKRGRDLFDLWCVIEKNMVDINKVVAIFNHYNNYNKSPITRAMFEESLHEKEKLTNFISDAMVLFPPEFNWESAEAFETIRNRVIPKMKGEPWKTKNKIDAILET